MEKYEFLETTDVKNVWKKYGLTGNAFILPWGKTFFFPFFSFFSFRNNSNRFSVVVKRPPLHFLGDLSQALLRELARVKLLHTPRACSKYWLRKRANIILDHNI